MATPKTTLAAVGALALAGLGAYVLTRRKPTAPGVAAVAPAAPPAAPPPPETPQQKSQRLLAEARELQAQAAQQAGAARAAEAAHAQALAQAQAQAEAARREQQRIAEQAVKKLEAELSRLELDEKSRQVVVEQVHLALEKAQAEWDRQIRGLQEELSRLKADAEARQQALKELEATLAKLQAKLRELERLLEDVPKTVTTGRVADFGAFSTITQRRTRTFFVPFDQAVQVSYYVHAQMKIGFFVFNYGGAYVELRTAQSSESRELPGPLLGALSGLLNRPRQSIFRTQKGRCSNCAESKTITLNLRRGVYTIEAGMNPPGAAEITVRFKSKRFLEE